MKKAKRRMIKGLACTLVLAGMLESHVLGVRAAEMQAELVTEFQKADRWEEVSSEVTDEAVEDESDVKTFIVEEINVTGGQSEKEETQESVPTDAVTTDTADTADTTIPVDEPGDFGTISESFYMPQSGIYVLQKDITLSVGIGIAAGSEVTIDLNGYVLNMGSAAISCAGTFTLKDSSGTNRGSVMGSMTVWLNAIVNMEGGTIQSATGNGTGVSVAGGTFNMTGGSITKNGRGVYVTGYKYGWNSVISGTFNMSGGSITQNTNTDENGGGVYINSGTFNMTGGSIAQNTGENGGGVYSNSGTIINITGGIISQNAGTNGGGIYNSANKAVIGGNAVIAENTADVGGGIYNSGRLEISSGAIVRDNIVTKWGGGILNGNSATLTNKGTICGNIARRDGGGVTNDGTFYNEGVISNNHSTELFGGGICNNRTLELRDGTVITGNTAKEYAGGIILRYDYSNYGTTISGKVIVNDNTANGQEDNLAVFCSLLTVRAISEGSQIGINRLIEGTTTDNGGENVYIRGCDLITTGYKANVSTNEIKYFYLDDAQGKNYILRLNDAGELETAEHIHTWNYSTKENKIIAYCTTAETKCSHYAANAETAGEVHELTMSVEGDMEYSGSAYMGVSLDDKITVNTGADEPVITYYRTQAHGSVQPAGSALAGAPKDVGTYVAVCTLTHEGAAGSGAQIKLAFNINKAVITPAVTLDNYTYGTHVTPTVTGNAGNAQVTYSYKKKGADDSTYANIDADGFHTLDAGGYTLKAVVAECTTHKGGTVSCDFTVNKKKPAVEVYVPDRVYGAEAGGPILSDTSNPGNGTVTYTYRAGDSTDEGAWTETVPVNVGNYSVKASVAETANYESASGTAQFRINPGKLTIIPTQGQSKLYGEEEPVLTYSVLGIVAADKGKEGVISGSLSRAEGEDVKTGGYEITKGTLNALNYDINVLPGVTFRIKPCSLDEAVITLEDAESVYTGQEISREIKSVALNGRELTEADYEEDTASVHSATEYGTYLIKIKGKGNYTGMASVEWRIRDASNPTGNILIKEHKWNSLLNEMTFGLFFTATQEVTIQAEDAGSGVDEVYYYNADKPLTEDEVKALPESAWTKLPNGGSYVIHPDAQYVIYAKITDKSGNMVYISSEGMILDATAPKVEGIINGGIYCRSVSFETMDEHPDKVCVDGKETTEYTIKGDDKLHTVSVTDLAGNLTEYEITVYKDHVFTAYHQESVQGETVTEKALCDHGCGAQAGRVLNAGEVIREEDPSGGSIATAVHIGEGSPVLIVKGLTTERAKELLTEEEKELIKNGEAVTVWLAVERKDASQLSDAEKQQTEQYASEIGDMKSQIYLDLSIWKQVGSREPEKIKDAQLGGMLEISMLLSEELKAPEGTTRTYQVIRTHKGESSLLETKLENDRILFETDCFSLYTIGYAEKNENKHTPTAEATEGSKDTNTNSGESSVEVKDSDAIKAEPDKVTEGKKDSVPRTGDENPIPFYLLLCALGAVGMVYSGRKKCD